MKLQLIPPTQEKILSIFLSKSEAKYYTNELIRLTGDYPNSVQYALNSLTKRNLLKTQRINNKKYYWLNKDNPILQEIDRIFIKRGLIDKDLEKEEKSDWIKLLNRDASLAFQAETPLVNRDVLPKVIDYSMNNFWYNGITFGVYYKQDELKNLADAILRKIRKDPKFVERNIKDCYILGEKLIQNADCRNNKELKKLSNKDLLDLFVRFRSAYQNFLPYLVYPHSIERYFSNRIEQELKLALNRIKKENQFDKIFKLLTSPATHEIEEQIDMLTVADLLKKNGLSKEVKDRIKIIHNKYSWQPFFTICAKPLTLDYYKDSLIALSKTTKSAKKEIERIKREQKNRKQKLLKTLNSIKASSNMLNLVEMLQAYINIRTYRKNIISKAHFLHLPLLLEVANRMKIGDDIKLASYDEIYTFLKDKKNISKVILRKRKQGWGIISVDGKINVVSGLDEVLEIMEQFQIGQSPIPTPTQQTIKGNPACRGSVIGKVKIIKHIKELNRIEKDDILVTSMTTPDYVSAFGKIKGIITDEGGITCHAAIVSREYNIPCIIATGNATKILQDGNLVQLDAFSGLITILETNKQKITDNVIQGQVLFKGKVEGKVLVVESDDDLKKVTSDSIVVSNSITPRYLSALYKAKGFVVDEYFPTSHAYLYAHTLKIPSLGGIKNSTKILKTGDKVILNANRGYLKFL